MKARELSGRHPLFPELLTARAINLNTRRDDTNLRTGQDEANSLAKKQAELISNSRQETDLTKPTESCSLDPSCGNDTMSLEETPAVEIIKTSELNNKDPICPELLTCNDPIENIAGELSSPLTKSLLIKELEGKIETIADLAKMTELEVNRLCIKAPKVKVAKKALTDYAAKLAKKAETVIIEVEKQVVPDKINVEVQTNEVSANSVEVQTTVTPVMAIDTQTDKEPIAHNSCQTDESGFKSTKDVISTYLKERPDFVEELSTQLNEAHIQKISTKLPFEAAFGLLKDKLTSSNSGDVLNFILEYSANSSLNSNHRLDLKNLQELLFKNLSSQDVAKLCVQLLKRIHDID